MSKQPEALVNLLAGWEDENGAMGAILPCEWEAIRDQFTAACVIQSPRMLRNELRRLHAANAEMVEALSEVGMFLHHAWADVQMNDYSFERLNKAMESCDTALSKHKEQA